MVNALYQVFDLEPYPSEKHMNLETRGDNSAACGSVKSAHRQAL